MAINDVDCEWPELVQAAGAPLMKLQTTDPTQQRWQVQIVGAPSVKPQTVAPHRSMCDGDDGDDDCDTDYGVPMSITAVRFVFLRSVATKVNREHAVVEHPVLDCHDMPLISLTPLETISRSALQ